MQRVAVYKPGHPLAGKRAVYEEENGLWGSSDIVVREVDQAAGERIGPQAGLDFDRAMRGFWGAVAVAAMIAALWGLAGSGLIILLSLGAIHSPVGAWITFGASFGLLVAAGILERLATLTWLVRGASRDHCCCCVATPRNVSIQPVNDVTR